MSTRKHNIIIAAVLGIFIIIFGSAGYIVLEDWEVLDAVYMTIITVATIGYGEVRPLSQSGRIFTLFIIIFGVGNAAYLVGQFTKLMVEGSIQLALGRRKLETQIKKMKNHYVLCGYGRIGRMIAKEVMARQKPLVVIENHPEVIEQLENDGCFYIKGDASDEDNLLAAGIEKALGLISAVSSDADNLYIVLTARGLNPDLIILSRASEEKSIRKLKGAGADRVISPYLIGARKMAQAILRPAVADFVESTLHGGEDMHIAMEEVLVTPQSRIKDVSLLESNIRRDLDLIIIAIKRAEGPMDFNPSANALIRVGDTLIAVGLKKNMESLIRILGADTAQPIRWNQ